MDIVITFLNEELGEKTCMEVFDDICKFMLSRSSGKY